MRSGQRWQSVIRKELALALYVSAAHSIYRSAGHQWPGEQSAHASAPVSLAYVPGAHGSHGALPLAPALVPRGQGCGRVLASWLK